MQKLQPIASALAAGGARLSRRLSVRLSDERGIALVMALGIMLVLAIALTTTIYLTSSSGRHANSSNAGQKSSALAEAGVNNAISALHGAYDVTPAPAFPGEASALLVTPPPGLPGNPLLVLPTRTPAYDGGSCTAPVNNCVTWSGSLPATAPGAQWPYEWRITSTGTVANPTGPGTSPVTRKQTAVVPVVFAKQEDPGANSVLNWLYAAGDITFQQSVTIGTPVYATGNLDLGSTATITSAARSVAVGGNLILENPQNQIGASTSRLQTAYVRGSCKYKNNPAHTPCQWDTDNVFTTGPGGLNQGATTIPSTLLTQIPTLSCCSMPPAASPSQMGYWYRFASPGPYFPCVTSSGTVPVFDTNTALDNSASGAAAQDLTPASSYSCTTPGGSISWNASAKQLTIDGTVYIDGSAYMSSTSGTYSGVGTIVLTGTFSMDNNKQMCAN